MPDPHREQRRQAVDLMDQHGDLLAAKAWATVRRHPHNAGCWCLVIDLLVELIELGYTITPPPSNNHQTTGGPMKITRNVCDCGCGEEVPEGKNFVPSHDTVLLGKLWKKIGKEISGDQFEAMVELFRRNWHEVPPANWARRVPDPDRFMSRRVEERMREEPHE